MIDEEIKEYLKYNLELGIRVNHIDYGEPVLIVELVLEDDVINSDFIQLNELGDCCD